MKDQDYIQTKKELHKVSDCFCLAKWLQVTIDLKHGTTHSCHHPVRHAIPYKELKCNPSALHNTNFKKQQRKKMLHGERPTECAYCWNVEDSPGDHFSDRILKSAAYWAHPYIDKVVNGNWKDNVNPSYVEIMFGSECNFTCMYCNADTSTTIYNEMRQFGPYPISDPCIRMPHRDNATDYSRTNAYVKAFWEWWPSLAPDLEVFRITGGEPLLNSNTFDTFNYILENPLPSLTLGINTNLGIKQNVFETFLGEARKITAHDKVRRLEVFTSVDTHGNQAEYIRTGLNYSEILQRADRICCELPTAYLVFMVNYSILSIPKFGLFLKDILTLKKTHQNRVIVDISYLMHPRFLAASLIEPDFYPLLDECYEFMRCNHVVDLRVAGFSFREMEKMNRIISWIKGKSFNKNDEADRSDFRRFIDEYDRRKGTCFLSSFPEFKEFYSNCLQQPEQNTG